MKEDNNNSASVATCDICLEDVALESYDAHVTHCELAQFNSQCPDCKLWVCFDVDDVHRCDPQRLKRRAFFDLVMELAETCPREASLLIYDEYAKTASRTATSEHQAKQHWFDGVAGEEKQRRRESIVGETSDVDT